MAAAETSPKDILPILCDLPEEMVGERVILRPYRTGDGDALWEAVQESREHLLPWLPWGPSHASPADSEAFVRRSYAAWIMRTDDIPLSIWEKSSGRLLGGAGLHRINWKVRSFEIGYWLRKSAEGHGYMTETVGLLCRLGFEVLGANRVFIRCAHKNLRSAAVPKRAGFVFEGTFRSSHRNADDELCDMLVFAMTAQDYRAHVGA